MTAAPDTVSTDTQPGTPQGVNQTGQELREVVLEHLDEAYFCGRAGVPWQRNHSTQAILAALQRGK